MWLAKRFVGEVWRDLMIWVDLSNSDDTRKVCSFPSPEFACLTEMGNSPEFPYAFLEKALFRFFPVCYYLQVPMQKPGFSHISHAITFLTNGLRVTQEDNVLLLLFF